MRCWRIRFYYGWLSASRGVASVPNRFKGMKTLNLLEITANRFAGLLPPPTMCMVLFVLVLVPHLIAQDWHVDKAPIRFELRITEHPTHQGSGYFVSLPDGGLLPGPCPVTRVVTGDGRPIESCALWHNPESRMGMVFSDAGFSGGVVFVYVIGAKNYSLWHSKSAIKPSAILASAPGSDKMADAQALASFGRVGRNVMYWNRAGANRAPLCIEGDLAGRRRPGAFYLLAHVITDDPGRTWIAPFTQHGETRVRVNGSIITPHRRIDKWGGTGQWVDLESGLNRIEVFQTAPGSGDYSGKYGGLMYLTWRTPNASMRELGGVRSEAVPMAGTSRMETRVLRKDEVVRSGGAVVESARSMSGGPLAVINAAATQVFWVDKEMPLFLYKLSAAQDGNPQETRYEWEFGDGARAAGGVVYWLLPGYMEHKIRLSAETDTGKSETVVYLYAFSHVSTSLNNPDDRKAYRSAMLQMLQAYSGNSEALATWDVAYWNNLLRTMDFGSGYEILLFLFEEYYTSVSARLAPRQIVILQEMFLDAASGAAPKDALKWLRKFHDDTEDEDRHKHLVVREAEIHAHYLDDFATAKQLLAPLSRNADYIGQLARIRLGDIAFMEGDLNLATRSYANVQSLVRHDRKMAGDIYDDLAEGVTTAPVEVRKGPLTVAEKLKADREKFMEASRRQKEKFAATVGRSGNAASRPAALWKLGSLLDASASENVKQLITDGYWLEARQSLDVWERELPLSKIAGDYILQESRLYFVTGNPRRAYGMLRAYCDQVDASSYLPEAAKLVLACMKDLQFPPEEISSYGKKLRERLEFHPAADDIEVILRSDKVAPGAKTMIRSEKDLELLKSLFEADE